MNLIQQMLGVIVILCALYILKDTIPKMGKYPSWISQSIIILVIVGTLWGVVSIAKLRAIWDGRVRWISGE